MFSSWTFINAKSFFRLEEPSFFRDKYAVDECYYVTEVSTSIQYRMSVTGKHQGPEWNLNPHPYG
jgi:hypothetical protein